MQIAFKTKTHQAISFFSYANIIQYCIDSYFRHLKFKHTKKVKLLGKCISWLSFFVKGALTLAKLYCAMPNLNLHQSPTGPLAVLILPFCQLDMSTTTACRYIVILLLKWPFEACVVSENRHNTLTLLAFLSYSNKADNRDHLCLDIIHTAQCECTLNKLVLC